MPQKYDRNITKAGEITLITGPMFAAKTTQLIQHLEVASIEGKKICVIKFDKDNRVPGAENYITTHEKSVVKGRLKVRAYPVSHLKGDFTPTLEEKLEEADLIAIDEGQFLEGLADFCTEYASKGKDVVVAALNGDFKQTQFEPIRKLTPHADYIKPLKAVCSVCKNYNAIYTQRKSEEKSLIVIGGKDMYRAICRSCLNWSKNGFHHTSDPIFKMDPHSPDSSLSFSELSSSSLSSSADE